jgi:hypothetical protein
MRSIEKPLYVEKSRALIPAPREMVAMKCLSCEEFPKPSSYFEEDHQT